MRAELIGWRQMAPEIRQFDFAVPEVEELRFLPGQFVSLTETLQDKKVTRAYSIASRPGGNRFSICLNRVEGGLFSPHLFALETGGSVEMKGPLGVFVCYDGRARHVLEACQLRGWTVPDEIAVLGVDNDEVLCELCTPPLSSVQPNARRTGFEAAELLSRMMRGEKPGRMTRRVEPVRVVERQSTDTVAVADAKVAAAVRFIREHVGDGIDVGDVLRAVPMSRTLLERKFQAALGRSPHREILQQRIARARHLLAESEVSIAVVAELAGFGDASYLSVVFRRETGESPRSYRVRQRVAAADR